MKLIWLMAPRKIIVVYFVNQTEFFGRNILFFDFKPDSALTYEHHWPLNS